MLVQSATYSESRDEQEQSVSSLEYPLSNSIEQKYLEVMKKLQFGKFESFSHQQSIYSHFFIKQILPR